MGYLLNHYKNLMTCDLKYANILDVFGEKQKFRLFFNKTFKTVKWFPTCLYYSFGKMKQFFKSQSI